MYIVPSETLMCGQRLSNVAYNICQQGADHKISQSTIDILKREYGLWDKYKPQIRLCKTPLKTKRNTC